MLFFHQLLAGVDVAIPERAGSKSQLRIYELAKGMKNYIYLVGDARTRECIAVDAVYDPEGEAETLAAGNRALSRC